MGLIAEPLHQRHSAGLKSHAQLIKRVFLSISAPKTRHLIGCDTARGHNIVGIIEHIGSVKLKTVYPDGSQSFQLLIHHSTAAGADRSRQRNSRSTTL